MNTIRRSFQVLRCNPRVLAWTAPLALTALFGFTVWELIVTIHRPVSNNSIRGSAQSINRTTNIDIERLVGRHIFGSVETTISDSSATSPVGRVIGIAAFATGRSVAILDVGGTQKTYVAGDQLPNGAVVVAISADQVILEDHGVRRSIHLDINMADTNDHFATLAVGDELQGPSTRLSNFPIVPASSPEQTLDALRSEILARLHRSPAGRTDPPSQEQSVAARKPPR